MDHSGEGLERLEVGERSQATPANQKQTRDSVFQRGFSKQGVKKPAQNCIFYGKACFCSKACL